MLPNDLRELLLALNEHGVEYLHVISAEDLIRNKTAVGRLQDLADAEAVRRAAKDS